MYGVGEGVAGGRVSVEERHRSSDLGLSQPSTTMGSGPNKIARSPTPPETDDDGEEWPVHGIVGEDVDVFGISRYARISLKNPTSL